MTSKLLKKCIPNFFISKNYIIVEKFCSVVHSQPLPKEMAELNITRKNKKLFQDHFIENLFLNKIEMTIFEYPQIDSLKEIQSLSKINNNIRNLLINEMSSVENKNKSETSIALTCLKNVEVCGFQLPLSQKGYGFLEMESTFIQESLRNVNSSLAQIVADNENFGIELINKSGSIIHKEKYLPKLASGESLACFAYLEPEPFVSLDPLSLNLKAVKSSDNETFIVSGKKNWVYNAKHADVLIFLASITSTNNKNLGEPAIFVVDKNLKGIIVHEPIKTVGLKHVDICSISFNEVEIPSSCILGKPEEGENLFKKIFSKRKLSDGVECLVIMKKLISLVINNCIHNRIFKKNKWEQDFYKIEVGKLVSRLYAVESMIYLIAGRLDNFDDANVFLESLILKIVSSEALQYILQQSIAIIGTEFYAEENENLRTLVTDYYFFSSHEHTNDYLRILLSTAGCKHVFKYRNERSTLSSLKDFRIMQEIEEKTIERDRNTINSNLEAYGYVHPLFKIQSALFEDTVFLLKKNVDYLLKKYDKNIYDRHIEMQLLANLAVNIYTMVAILGRSSRAYCLGFHRSEADKMIAESEILRLKHESEKYANFIKNKEVIQNFNEIESKNGNFLKYADFIKHTTTFETFLINSKKEVGQKLKQKVFPSSEIEDYDFLRLLGEGSYGKVVTAQNIRSKKRFAIKIIDKKILIREDHLKHLISEIRILNAIKFEFLISLECYFTNKCYVFIVLPYIDGGHFLRLLKKVKHLNEEAARFFAGQIILAIEYLHYMGIIYRDLKPENLLLDFQGYLKLVDFGFSKNIGRNHSYTFCGTPEYIAPEIILSKGYRLSPDWWALGILLYEMCSGTPPFTSKNELKLYEKIIIGKIIWPDHFSYDLKSLIQGLLQVDRSKRLGCMKNKAQDVKLHSWFSRFDWTALWNKKILPPIKYELGIPSSRFRSEGDKRIKFSITKCKTLVPPKLIGNIDFAI